ncbi:helix-turn-helix domain-containing protein [Sphaerisporangium aureirubrum]|uniref:Helix-turn-helix domain-containing protein n=1 Tax=Sphaerisporangium aureirubrum TaxID=1544736 RepID=A0ABW1NCE2_9ACTN
MPAEARDQTVSDVIAAQVRLRRRRADLTRDQLAEACARHGAPELTFGAITNIETGRPDPETGRRRRHVTVDELIVLAQALNVAPLDLIYPGDHQAAAWFTGLRGQTESTDVDQLAAALASAARTEATARAHDQCKPPTETPDVQQ